MCFVEITEKAFAESGNGEGGVEGKADEDESATMWRTW